jgi:hypothetical protein
MTVLLEQYIAFLQEMPYMHSSGKTTTDDPSGDRNVHGTDSKTNEYRRGKEKGLVKKISELDGHHIYRSKSTSKYGDDHRRYYAVHPETDTVHMSLAGGRTETDLDDDKERFETSELGSHSKNKLPSENFYHHILMHHEPHLISDTRLTPGSKKTWERLSKKPGAKVNLQPYDSVESHTADRVNK